jgi:type II secretory pathway predicted ATPase ExeA
MNDLSFGLQQRPFPAAPLAAAYHASLSHQQARRQLHRCVQRSEGAGVVIAAAGLGKSLLLHVLADEFRDRFHVSHLAGAAICTRKALLQNILFELGLPYRGLQEGELRLSLIDHLQPSRQCPHGMLLLIDEAHTLPLRLLEELRLLTNLGREGSPRVRLVLAGSRSLEERLANPKLDSFQQRIAARTYLQPWSSQETADYVRQEVTRCGGRAFGIFTADALKAVHVAAAGIPRLVNQICDHALTLAAANNESAIDGAAIEAAWAELQQLPMPWSEPATETATIEFGSLDEVAFDEVILDEAAPEGDAVDEAHASSGLQDLLTHVELDAEPLTAEAVVPSHAELFGEGFDDEEIVIDRHNALSVQALGERPEVVTSLGQEFAREVAILPLEITRPALRIVDVADEPVTRSPTLSTATVLAVHDEAAEVLVAADEAEFDPVYPADEEATVGCMVGRNAASFCEPGSASQRKVVAIDSAQSMTPEPHVVKAPLGRFRNLFANLRNKKN